MYLDMEWGTDFLKGRFVRIRSKELTSSGYRIAQVIGAIFLLRILLLKILRIRKIFMSQMGKFKTN